MKICRNNTHHRRANAFSLLELLAVVTILGIIAVVVIPRIAVSSSTAKANAQAQTVAEINGTLERYYFDHGSFPADLATFWAATTSDGHLYFPEGAPMNQKTSKPGDFAYDFDSGRVAGK
jgi:general secretion pathway protein G